MTGPQLATLSTVAWVILTMALILVLGARSAGGSWTILPGLVRGIRDWAAEHAAARSARSPSPWSVEPPPIEPSRPADLPTRPPEPDETELGVAILEDLGGRRLD